jgi:hypothetical protein
MTPEELKKIIERFSQGETTEDEENQLMHTLSNSLEMFSFFLNEIKIAQIKQQITNSN